MYNEGDILKYVGLCKNKNADKEYSRFILNGKAPLIKQYIEELRKDSICKGDKLNSNRLKKVMDKVEEIVGENNFKLFKENGKNYLHDDTRAYFFHLNHQKNMDEDQYSDEDVSDAQRQIEIVEKSKRCMNHTSDAVTFYTHVQNVKKPEEVVEEVVVVELTAEQKYQEKLNEKDSIIK